MKADVRYTLKVRQKVVRAHHESAKVSPFHPSKPPFLGNWDYGTNTTWDFNVICYTFLSCLPEWSGLAGSAVSHGQSGWSCIRSKVKHAPWFLRLGPSSRGSGFQGHILSIEGSAIPGALTRNWLVATFSKDLHALMDHIELPSQSQDQNVSRRGK